MQNRHVWRLHKDKNSSAWLRKTTSLRENAMKCNEMLFKWFLNYKQHKRTSNMDANSRTTRKHLQMDFSSFVSTFSQRCIQYSENSQTVLSSRDKNDCRVAQINAFLNFMYNFFDIFISSMSHINQHYCKYAGFPAGFFFYYSPW